MKPFIFIALLFVFSSSTGLEAQEPGDEVDPLMGSYILGNSAELVFQYVPVEETINNQIFDYIQDSTGIKLAPAANHTDTIKSAGPHNINVVTGDFNGDDHDNIFTARETENHSILLSVTLTIDDSLKQTGNHIFVLDSVLFSSIHLFTGDFDRDRQKEAVLAYHGLDDYLHICLFETDSALNIKKLAEVADYSMANGTSLFDLAAGDFDCDGLDEVVLIHPLASDYVGNSNYKMRSMVKVYDYNHYDGQFIPKKSGEVSVINHFDPEGSPHISSQIKRIVISTGNFDGDSQDEVIYGYEIDFYYSFMLFRYTYFYNRICLFEIGTDLEEKRFDENSFGEVGNWSTADLKNYFISGFPMSIDAHDMNLDGIDEVIALGSRDLTLFKIGENKAFEKVGHANAFSKYNAAGHCMLSVADLNADTTAIDSGRWIPEIVLVDFTNDPAPFPGDPGLARLRVFSPNINETNEITGITNLVNVNPGINGSKIYSCAIALGDLDGDAVRLGKPRLFSKTSVIQPTVILNAPPIHFDIINGIPYDLNHSYNDNVPEFMSSYEFTTSSEKQVESEVHSDWGVSASLSFGGSFLGIGAKTTLTSKYGEGFSKSELHRNTTVIEQKCNATVDDEIYATVTDYSFWEYPVYFKQEHYGYIMVAVPYLKGNTWFPSKSWTGISHIPNHEVGNILSYPFYKNVSHNPDLSELIWDFGPEEIHGTSDRTETFTNTQFTSSGAQTSWDFGMSINSSVWGWGFSLETEAHYNMGEINTHHTSVSEEFKVCINMAGVDTEIGEVSYTIRPYAYWSGNGAMVVDYNAEPHEAPPGQPVTWWQRHYGEHPDPAFILPWLYDPEKGYKLEEDAKRNLTREILINPNNPQEGDTVNIKARLHNYSLLDTDGPVKVGFFIGDPDNGGRAIVGLHGETECSTPDIIQSRGEAFVEMDWIVPADVSEYTRIYALIDPENEINELRENNNKGFIVLTLDWATNIEKERMEKSFDQSVLMQNYPNPFRNNTTIKFDLPGEGNVKVNILNTLGEIIYTVVDEHFEPGVHEVECALSQLSNGIYFFRMEYKEFIISRRMVILK